MKKLSNFQIQLKKVPDKKNYHLHRASKKKVSTTAREALFQSCAFLEQIKKTNLKNLLDINLVSKAWRVPKNEMCAYNPQKLIFK